MHSEVMFSPLVKRQIMKYIATTIAGNIPCNIPSIQVDGTVPGFSPATTSWRFDHHRNGGAEVQIHELPTGEWDSWIEETIGDYPCTMVTTQVDADACVAAAYLQLSPEVAKASYEKLEAIAYDCDHLAVPPHLAHLSEFAARNVAALKQMSFELVTTMGLPTNRKDWAPKQKLAYANACFEQGTQALIDACNGIAPFPSESAYADKYWEQVLLDLAEITTSYTMVTVKNGYPVFDMRGITRYIDPRVPLRVLAERYGLAQNPVTITVRQRPDGTASYTLGVVPLHPKVKNVDLNKVYPQLTALEPQGNDPWGGRKTVGGSGWNTGSILNIEDIISVLDS